MLFLHQAVASCQGEWAGLSLGLSLACWMSSGPSHLLPRPFLHTCHWGDGSCPSWTPSGGCCFPHPSREPDPPDSCSRYHVPPLPCAGLACVLHVAEEPCLQLTPKPPPCPGASSQAADPVVGVGAVLCGPRAWVPAAPCLPDATLRSGWKAAFTLSLLSGPQSLSCVASTVLVWREPVWDLLWAQG